MADYCLRNRRTFTLEVNCKGGESGFGAMASHVLDVRGCEVEWVLQAMQLAELKHEATDMDAIGATVNWSVTEAGSVDRAPFAKVVITANTVLHLG